MLQNPQTIKLQDIEYVTQMAKELAKMAFSQNEAVLGALLNTCVREGKEILRSSIKSA